MKRLALLIFCAVLLLSSCSGKPAEIVRDFSVKADVAYNQRNYKCLINSGGHSLVSVRLMAPDSLKGLCFSYRDGKTEITRGGLKISADGVYQPQGSMPQTVYNILSALGREGGCEYSGSYNDLAAFKGSSDSGAFTVYTDYSSGNISRIELDDGSMTAVFD